MAINVATSPFEVSLVQRGNISHTPAAPRNPELDQVLTMREADIAANSTITLSLSGDWLGRHIIADPFILILDILGDEELVGNIWTGSVLLVTTTLRTPDIVTEGTHQNWVNWSDIGSFNFTINKSNVAGTRPMDWKGWVYAIKKLGKKVVVYGQNGVSFLHPNGTAWGLDTVSRIGLKGRGAVCGDDFVHFFVDISGRLWKVGEGIELLDYSEYLDSMNPSITLSYDEANQLIFICDGALGYIYGIKEKSLGKGPSNVSGVGSQSGTLYVTSPAAAAIPTFDLCTDIYDLGTRKNKTIANIDVGTDVVTALYVAVDYRLDKAGAFATSPWKRVNPSGTGPLPCFGVEFRFRLRALAYEYFEVDYIRVTGVIHNYSYLDSFLYLKEGTR